MRSTVHSFRTPEGVTLGVEHFGDAAAPLVLLAGGTTMLSWPDALCESLAPCVLAPSLRGLDLCDDANVVPRTYGDPVLWDGLGILDYVFVPHFDSPGHPETQAIGVVAAHYRAHEVPHRTLRDGQALVVNGQDTRIY